MERAVLEILGVPIHLLSMEEALNGIMELVETEGPSLVFTPNPELLVRAYEDPDLLETLKGGHLFLPDGTGILLGVRYKGYPLKERVTGIDVVQNLLEKANGLGLSFYFLGGRPEVAAKALEKVRERFPSLHLLGSHHGYLKREEEEIVIQEINQLKPQILLVGMGAPRQEIFLLHYKERLAIKVGITVGGSLDVLAGELRRAPKWMMGLHLEWFFRLLQEPSRWRRMLALPRFLYLLLREGR